MNFSGELNAPTFGKAQDSVKANGKIDLKIAGGNMYMHIDNIQASSPDTKLSDAIGAGVGMLNGVLGGKWIVVDLAKYESAAGSGSIDPMSVTELYTLQKTASDLLKKYPFLKNNGEITENGTKGYLVSFDNEHILTIYDELTKNPTVKKIMQDTSKGNMKDNRASLEKALKESSFSGKLLSKGKDDMTLKINTLKIENG